jgi:hypothetical protein
VVFGDNWVIILGFGERDQTEHSSLLLQSLKLHMVLFKLEMIQNSLIIFTYHQTNISYNN